METLDIVNENDEVVGQASYREIYEKLHAHRIVHILIFNNEGKMALQLRSKTKSFCPQHWSTSVGGHVQAGESYEQAALREMREEIGVETTFDLIAKDSYIDISRNNFQKFLATFRTIYEGSLNLNPEEVEKFEFFSLKEIQEMIDQGEKFNPELLFLLKKHFGLK